MDNKAVAYGGIIAVIGITGLVLWKTILGNTSYVAEDRTKRDDDNSKRYAAKRQEGVYEKTQAELNYERDNDPTSPYYKTAVGGKKSKRAKVTKRTKRK